MEKIKFVLINKENIEGAISLVKEIFPYEYKNGIFLPEEEYRLSLEPSRVNLQQFFTVTYEGQPVGITGYNFNYQNYKHNELWLGYFGVKEKFRSNGLGKKIILKTLELMKKFNSNLKTIKLWTSNREQEKSSHHLYRCVGFRLYAHRNTRPFHTYYFKINV